MITLFDLGVGAWRAKCCCQEIGQPEGDWRVLVPGAAGLPGRGAGRDSQAPGQPSSRGILSVQAEGGVEEGGEGGSG